MEYSTTDATPAQYKAIAATVDDIKRGNGIWDYMPHLRV